MIPRTWDEYKQSLDCLVMVTSPKRERIEAAYVAGAVAEGAGSLTRTPPSNLAHQARSPYLWERIGRAFELGREAGR